jgi:3-oxoadipate CoA-transferase beta subunit
MKPLTRKQIAWRAAQDISDGSYVNLGIGLPTMVAGYVPADREILFHSENGVLGFHAKDPSEPDDPEMINAGKEPISLLDGGCFFKHTDSFVMIRGGHLDIALLGAFEVSEEGDLANWTTEAPDSVPGVGGAMDLACGAKQIRVLMEHTARDGTPRIKKQCHYPLTAAHSVNRIYTNLAIIDVTPDGLLVRELVPGMTLEALQAQTEPPLKLADDAKDLVAPALD